MRRTQLALALASIGFVVLPLSLGSPALAQVTQPNGTVMPVDSMNGETQLYTLFSDAGETLDYRADGASSPAVFSPLCAFRATFVLKQSGSSLGVGWYNADPAATTPPALGDIHVIVPAGTAVGAVITAADIRTDAAYAGGQIGFALVGGQTFYTEARFNPQCTSCATPGPWIMAVIYPSTTTANAFYIAFEDGTVGSSPSSFNNDGDYNDYVFLFEGITCTGGGEPCDTGMPGICAAGLTQCTRSGTECAPSVVGRAEICNGLDEDCDGMVDDGELCATGFVCDRGTCVGRCGSGEFTCDFGLSCSADGFCVEEACAAVDCPAGEVCRGGDCMAPCDGVVCPFGDACRAGRCVDPCAGVACDDGQVCEAGVCVESCECAACATGLTCVPTAGLCAEPSCVDVACALGTHCVVGACVDDCAGAMCPAAQFCVSGRCEDAPPPPDGGVRDGGPGNADAGRDAGATDGGRRGAPAPEDGGCGCAVPGPGTRSTPLAALCALALLLVRRRRR
jgi:MYXO-CTERM domain-containing protein